MGLLVMWIFVFDKIGHARLICFEPFCCKQSRKLNVAAFVINFGSESVESLGPTLSLVSPRLCAVKGKISRVSHILTTSQPEQPLRFA